MALVDRTMRAVVLSEPGVWGITVLPISEPGSGEALIRVGATGLCGTDLNVVAGSHALTRMPVVPGHEFFGEVVELGAPHPTLSEGMLVAVDPSVYCGLCRFCRRGQTNLCIRKGGYGIAKNGGFAEFALVATEYCHPLPEGFPALAGVLVEPAACAVHAFDRLGPVLGLDVLIAGAGPIGNLMAQLATRAGAASVSIVDIDQQRLSNASRLRPAATGSSIDGLSAGGARWPVIIEATGSATVFNQAIRALDRGGRLMVMGMAEPQVLAELPLYETVLREKTILTSFSVQYTMDRAIELIADHILDVDYFITDVFPLEKFGDALASLHTGSTMKSVIRP